MLLSLIKVIVWVCLGLLFLPLGGSGFGVSTSSPGLKFSCGSSFTMLYRWLLLFTSGVCPWILNVASVFALRSQLFICSGIVRLLATGGPPSLGVLSGLIPALGPFQLIVLPLFLGFPVLARRTLWFLLLWHFGLVGLFGMTSVLGGVLFPFLPCLRYLLNGLLG